MPSLFSADLLKLLLERKCNEEAKTIIVKENLQSAVDKLNNTLLHYTAQWNNAALTQYLLDSGNQVNVQNNLGKTPLMLALENGSSDAVEILIKAGASVLVEDKFGINILEMVGVSNWLCHEEGIMRILLSNSDVSVIANKLQEYRCSLTRVIFFRNTELTKLMLDRGYSSDVDENDPDFSGATALHVATKIFHVENVKLLLSYGAAINAEDNNDQTPIAYVFEGDISEHADERLQIMKTFVDHSEGENCMRYQDFIDSSVSDVLENGSKEVIKLLVQAGYEFEVSEDDGTYDDSSVHLIARNENPGVIKQIGDEVFFSADARNSEMETPLIIAASHGIVDTVEFLINHGADVDAMDYSYTTPLSTAVRTCKECVQVLLEHGASAQLVYIWYYDDERTILHDILESKRFEQGELVLSHLALHEARGKTLENLFYDTINSHERLRSDFELSKRELAVQIYEPFSVFDLLTANEAKFDCYLCNQELYSKLEDFCETCKIYYFKTILQKRVAKVEIKKNLFELFVRL